MVRTVHLSHWFESDDGEHFADLEVEVTGPTRETYWEPRYPGEKEPISLHIDDREVSLAEHEKLVRHILAVEPIPEPEEREYER